MAITQNPLPYAPDALSPHLSAETMSFHYGKHHKAYVDAVNAGIAGTDKAEKSLDEIILSAEGKLFNAAAQVWNHDFYWRSMRSGGGGEPKGAVEAAIRQHFGSFADFRKQFRDAAIGQFGSGWAWLVKDGSKLAVMATKDADLPLKHGKKALLTCDVWEHAYYIDYRNARPVYVDAFLDHLANWDFVAQNLD